LPIVAGGPANDGRDPIGWIYRAAVVASTWPVFGSIFWIRTLGELKQVPAVEGRASMRGDLDRAQCLAARRVKGVQGVSSRKPDVLPVIRDPMHVVDTRKGPYSRMISAGDRRMLGS
jgi:hypothetical protein